MTTFSKVKLVIGSVLLCFFTCTLETCMGLNFQSCFRSLSDYSRPDQEAYPNLTAHRIPLEPETSKVS